MKLFLFFVLFGTINLADFGRAFSSSNQAREFLRHRIEEAGSPSKLSVGDEKIHSSIVLPRFYFNRTFHLAWSNDKGPLPVADTLIAAIRDASKEGLIPDDYHLAKIEKTLGQIRSEEKKEARLNPLHLMDLDFLLTDAFLVLASHFHSGWLNPETLTPEWHPCERDADFAGILEKALQEKRIREALEDLLPKHEEYYRLRQALDRYRMISNQGGWPRVLEGPALRKGDMDERIIALGQRLILAGDLDVHTRVDLKLFDDVLERAVIGFQLRHGLDPDGIVGRQTLEDLNVPVEERIKQTMINMERWRWLPGCLEERHILINIANFELKVVEEGQTIKAMRVIVGRHYRQTPVFSGKMTYLVINPYWNVPPGIAGKDILPEVRKDIEYLANNNMRALQGWGANTVEIDPATVDWKKVTARNLPYRFRQDPGPDNALGRFKFMFPNKFHVYLHDTPKRELFLKAIRTFSSGCIRVENPFDLAEYLLSDRSEWKRDDIKRMIDRSVERIVTIRNPMPVHLLYWTAWADREGTINFRRDIYGRDKRLYAALQLGS